MVSGRQGDFARETIWITDGTRTKRHISYVLIPKGWRRGRPYKTFIPASSMKQKAGTKHG